MAVLSKILGPASPTVEGKVGEALMLALDTIYSKSAIVLTDIAEITGITSSVGSLLTSHLPLIGFTYEHPSEMELLKYEYSEYPFLNKTLISNSYLKQNTKLTLRSYRGITANNGIVTNIALNQLIFEGVEYYCDRGGTFRIMTMWGTFEGFVLETLRIIPPESTQAGGIGFEWEFKRLPFDTASTQNVYSDSLKRVNNSLPPVGV